MFNLMKLLSSPEGKRLASGLDRMAKWEKKEPREVISESVGIMERLEKIAKKKGKKISAVAQEALDLYEKDGEK